MTRTPSWLRLLLLAYPRRFRETQERDLLELYRDSQLPSRSVAWDLVKNAIAVRWDELGRHRDGPPRPRRASLLDSLQRDLRFGVRGFVKKPAFSALALLTLTLGIGATTAIFTVVHWVVLRPLPYPKPDQIVRVWWRPDSFNQRIATLFRNEGRSFESLSAFSGWAFTLTGAGAPEELEGAQVTTNHFSVLGVAPALGRDFLEEESVPGRADVAVISHALWQRRFGGETTVIGRRIELEGAGRNAYTVVGVMPASYPSIDPHRRWHVWVPLEKPNEENDDSWFLSVVARLKEGASLEEANQEVKQLARRVQQDWYPRTSDAEIGAARVERLAEVIVGPSLRTQLYLLLGAVAIVLLVACGNVASLFLARSGDREREVAVRSALGAGRGRVLRQLLTESLLLGLLGGLLGTGLAFAALSLTPYLPDELPRTAELSPDLRVLLVSLVVSLASGLFFGLVPAVRTTGVTVTGRLRSGVSGANDRSRSRLNKLVIAAEVAVSVVLVVAAGLLLESFWKLTRVDPGFDAERVLVIGVHTPEGRYPEASQKRQFFDELLSRLRNLPGVEAVGAIHLLPMSLGNWNFPYFPEGRRISENETPPEANFRVISPDYFRSMGIPLLSGRTISETDRHDAPRVGWINESMATESFSGEDPLGKEIHIFGPEGPVFTVAGVVADVRQHGLDAVARPEMYRPLEQWTLARNLVTLRTQLPPESLAAAARNTVWSLDPQVPIVQLSSMQAVVAGSIATTRFVTALLSAFAALTLFLAAVGVYGVTSYVVSQKTREIGLRVALGAGRSRVRRDSLSEGMRPVVLGILLGLSGAAATSRLIESLLFEVSATHLATFAGVAFILTLVALLACYLPARRASDVDPVVALRSD